MVLPLAMVVLVGLLALVALVVDSSITTNQQSTVQVNRRVALSDADSGLQAAIYRLSSQPWAPGLSYAIPTGDCFGTKDDGANTDGTCNGMEGTGNADGVTDSLGGMGSYTYHITTAMSQGGSPGCTGWWVNPGGIYGGLTQRCITATGTYNGVTRRVQERVAAQSWVFPVNGILSLGEMKWDTSGSQYLALAGTFQSNGLMTVGVGTQTTPDNLTGATLQSYGGFSFGPGESCTAPSCTKQVVSQPFSRGNGPNAAAYNAVWATNDDAKLTTTFGSSFNAVTRVLTLNNVGTPAKPPKPLQPSGTVSIPSGTYSLCGLTITNSAIATAANSHVTIYIDSPGTGDCGGSPRTSGSCPVLVQGAGGLTITGSEFYNPSGIPGNLQIFIYGNPGWTAACPLAKNDPGSVSIENVGNPTDSQGNTILTAAQLYAPDSYFTTTGAGIWWAGGIVAGGMESNDNDVWGFTQHPPTQQWFPAAWKECSVTPSSSSDPGSGCY